MFDHNTRERNESDYLKGSYYLVGYVTYCMQYMNQATL
jgi:hypothetical protein